MDQEYIKRLEKIEVVLNQNLSENIGEKWMNSVFSSLEHNISPQLIKSLTSPCLDILTRRGKMWRPLLMNLICESLGGGENALHLVPLVEFPHNASLIHDDIEDNSLERRGKPAIHIKYGIDVAINSGAFLYFLPLSCIESWDASFEKKNQVFNLWGMYMRRLHLGQAMDIEWHRNFSLLPQIEEYDTMCRLKTGSLASLAAILGVVTAHSNREYELIKTFGASAEKLGVGFQILDDVKNLTTGNPGKKRGDDIVEGKKSLPVLLYLHRYNGKKDFVAHCFSLVRDNGIEAPEVEEFISELSNSGAIEEAEKYGRAYISEACKVFLTQDEKLFSGLLDFIGVNI